MATVSVPKKKALQTSCRLKKGEYFWKNLITSKSMSTSSPFIHSLYIFIEFFLHWHCYVASHSE